MSEMRDWDQETNDGRGWAATTQTCPIAATLPSTSTPPTLTHAPSNAADADCARPNLRPRTDDDDP